MPCVGSKKAAFWLAASSAALTVAVSKACVEQGIRCHCDIEANGPPKEFEDVLQQGWRPVRRRRGLRSDTDYYPGSAEDEYGGNDVEEYEDGGMDTGFVDGEMPLSTPEMALRTNESSSFLGGPRTASGFRLDFRMAQYFWDSGCWQSPNTVFAAQWAEQFMDPIISNSRIAREPRQLAFIRHNIKVGIKVRSILIEL